MNERDSEQVAHSLIARGYERVAHEAEADVVLLNTCSVRDMADQKALGKMGMLGTHGERAAACGVRFPRLHGAGARRVAAKEFAACRSCRRDAEISSRRRLRGRTGREERRRDQPAIARRRLQRMDDPRFSIVDIAEEAGSQSTIRDQQLAPRQATAFVSIMQGCNMHCTFCIVPQTRGAERSRSIDEIVREVRDLVARGVKEVTLLGQIVNLYGRHEFPKIDNKSPFVQLLEAVHEIDGLKRLRFTSPHPIGFRDDLIDAICALAETGRARSSAAAIRFQQNPQSDAPRLHRGKICRSCPSHPAGAQWHRDYDRHHCRFSRRNRDDYKRTRDLVEQIQFDNAFVFRYSPRRDTPAAEMPEQIDERVKEERNQDLLRIVNESARRAGERLVGRDVEVLCEGPSKTNPARLMGRTRTNKIVVFEGDEKLVGEIVDVRIATGEWIQLVWHAGRCQPDAPAS